MCVPLLLRPTVSVDPLPLILVWIRAGGKRHEASDRHSLAVGLGLATLLVFAVAPIGIAVVGLWDEQVGSAPAYIRALVFLRPYPWIALLWWVYLLAARRKWLRLSNWNGMY